MNLIRIPLTISPDCTRVITKSFIPNGRKRVTRIINSLLAIDETEVNKRISCIISLFHDRHRDIERIFKDNYNAIADNITESISLERKLLIGSHFTMEYSVESAALFNPSIVQHPYPSDVEEGSLRVIVSFRAVGEGHISSIVFKMGIISDQGDIYFEDKKTPIEEATVMGATLYSKIEFMLSLDESNLLEHAKPVLDNLIDNFSPEELYEAIDKYAGDSMHKKRKKVIDTLLLLANTNYSLTFHPDTDISSRVIFPVSQNEKKGLEDARFVSFKEASKKNIYYATYSAFSGKAVIPQLIETRDFITFTISPLHGPGCQNKGMALFPEKIKNQYAMISRQDNENIFIMFSDSLIFWEKPILISTPKDAWEIIQLGNCGSPIKTEMGWLLLTHGVGAMRTYSIGAMLLDLNDPTKVIGKLKEPFIVPTEDERNGYVPNVVYSCGCIAHNGWLIIPYAASDTNSRFAKIKLNDLLSEIMQD